MARQSFSKFIRPEQKDRGRMTDRDSDILDSVLRYRFASAAQLVRLVGGNEDVTHRRLRRLWEWELVNRWAFPGIRNHSEFYYYLDSRQALDVLAYQRGIELHKAMLDEIQGHREKNYAGATGRGQHMQLVFFFWSTHSWSAACISCWSWPAERARARYSFRHGSRELPSCATRLTFRPSDLFSSISSAPRRRRTRQ